MKKRWYGSGMHKSRMYISKVSRTKVMIDNDGRRGDDGVGVARIEIARDINRKEKR